MAETLIFFNILARSSMKLCHLKDRFSMNDTIFPAQHGAFPKTGRSVKFIVCVGLATQFMLLGQLGAMPCPVPPPPPLPSTAVGSIVATIYDGSET